MSYLLNRSRQRCPMATTSVSKIIKRNKQYFKFLFDSDFWFTSVSLHKLFAHTLKTFIDFHHLNDSVNVLHPLPILSIYYKSSSAFHCYHWNTLIICSRSPASATVPLKWVKKAPLTWIATLENRPHDCKEILVYGLSSSDQAKTSSEYLY